jgi:hypothetical protein
MPIGSIVWHKKKKSYADATQPYWRHPTSLSSSYSYYIIDEIIDNWLELARLGGANEVCGWVTPVRLGGASMACLTIA